MKNKKDNPLYADFVRLFEKEKLVPEDVNHLKHAELQEFKRLINLRLNSLSGEQYRREFAHYKAILEPRKAESLTPALPPTTEFDDLMAIEKIERSHLQHLSPEKKEAFTNFLEEKIDTLKDVERDVFLNQISALLENDKIWEMNHIRISDAINKHVDQYGNIPSKSYLVAETGLSRPTITKHMQTLKCNPLINEQNETFAMMSREVLGRVLYAALHGDLGAAKLYFNTINKHFNGAGNDIVINNQNNIQVNSTILNQQTIQQLKPEQLQQIEEIIKRSLAEKGEMQKG